MLSLNLNSFLFWGADKSNDVFAGYTITLESGFPSEAIEVVLKSILNLDKVVGKFRQFIDGESMVCSDGVVRQNSLRSLLTRSPVWPG
jgi:hypothetical protein